MISFGPVPSRRLGKSLGINNIISPKTCSYSCIYCQVGKTKIKNTRRDSYYQPEMIYEEVNRHLAKLSREDYPDYLTFVSNGEPTLDVNLGSSIKLLKKTGIPVAVISNASLMSDESVRNDLTLADWVSVKMDAADNTTWQIINKPSPDLNFKKHIESINLFAREYKGSLNTETMVIKGVNDSVRYFYGIAGLISRIHPHKAYLSIPTRPPSVRTVKPPEIEKLNRAWHIFSKLNITTELLTGFEGTDTGYTGNIYEDILNITSVHPLREDTLKELLEKDKADYTIVKSLIGQKLIKQTTYKGRKFFIREYHINS